MSPVAQLIFAEQDLSGISLVNQLFSWGLWAARAALVVMIVLRLLTLWSKKEGGSTTAQFKTIFVTIAFGAVIMFFLTPTGIALLQDLASVGEGVNPADGGVTPTTVQIFTDG